MAMDKLLTQLTSGYPHATYRKITLYVSTRLGLLFRKAAAKDGFRLVDFGRILVTLGLTISLLTLDEAWVTGARKRALPGQSGEAGKRGYAYRNMGCSGVWIAVCLPVEVLRLVEEFARSSGLGRNQALQSFLQLGLATYLKGKRTLLETIAQVEKPTAL
jgi:hypothetical protein